MLPTATLEKLTPSSQDSEDEESTPVDILPSSNSFDRHSDGHLTHSAPISPALNNNVSRDSQQDSGSSGNLKSMEHSSPQASGHNDAEGDVAGPIEQWVTQPAAQGVLYKCRITRDRKGMDRGLFPIYYLHLERDYGKRLFCLAGRWDRNILIILIIFLFNIFSILTKIYLTKNIQCINTEMQQAI